MPDSPLDQRLSAVIGGRTAAAFKKGLRLETVGDLLTHYPRRYVQRGELTALDALPLDENVTIVGRVLDAVERRMKNRSGSILEVRISDDTGILSLTFFNQAWRKNDLKPGARGIFAGKVGAYRGMRQLTHPDYELFPADDAQGSQKTEAWLTAPVPIYPATSTVASWQIQKSVEVVLDTLSGVADPVPDAVRKGRRLVDFARALELIHRPLKDGDWGAARKSLRFQEAFVLQAALLQQRALLRSHPAVVRMPASDGLLAKFDRALPFTLTEDQGRVGAEIATDLMSEAAMNRLVQGEVGSGKTIVALRGMLTVAESGGQSALLAPTEVLAGQHLRSIVKTLGADLAAELRPTLITGQLPMAERRKATLAAASGQARIVIGTHALMSDNVQFFDLGLVVVDEQHRFGVEQREALRAKGAVPPHVLVLTATPIPRTVVMTVFGDLDVSTIAELPSGRVPIETHVVPLAEKPGWRQRIWQRVAEELALGRQVFVVCPAIDPKTTESASAPEPVEEPSGPPAANVTDVLAELLAHPALTGRTIRPLTGRMPSDEKDATMRAFSAGEIDVLVATTVIEVGVDVPNASVMVVLDADRFGVSQLHQLRGRVGRGGVPGLCLLVTWSELESLSRERVEAVASTLDGFELAQKDLELRREGDVLGSMQSGGRSSLRLLRVAKDGDLIMEARALAADIIDADPWLDGYPDLRQALARRLDETSREFMGKN